MMGGFISRFVPALLWVTFIPIACTSLTGAGQAPVTHGDDYPIALGGLAEADIDRILRFLADRPYVEALQRRLSQQEVSDIRVVSRNIVAGVAMFEVTAKAELHGSTASLVVIFVEESDEGLRVTWVGDGVIDAE